MSTRRTLSPHDRSRWLAARGGDQGAQQELVDTAIAGVAMRLRRFQGDDVQELEQMIAAAVLVALETGVEPDSSLDGFLQWRARGQISRFVRRRARDGGVAADVALAWARDDDSPLSRATGAELREAVLACIDKVPSKDQRESFRRRVLSGTEPRAIAAERGIEARRVRVWIARAAALVRECLGQRFATEELP